MNTDLLRIYFSIITLLFVSIIIASPYYSFADTKEADYTGLFYRGCVECVRTDAKPLSGKEIHVSPKGSDSNNGSSGSSALKTLEKALCNLRPGQTVFIHPGVYKECVIMAAFGDDRSKIVIKGVEKDGKKPVLDGGRKRTMGIAIVEGKNISVENIEFRNYTDEGLHVSRSRKIEVKDCIFHNNGFHSVEPDNEGEGFGISFIEVTDVKIENNLVYHNGPETELKANGILGMGIDTYRLENALIRGNTVYGTVGGGILVEDGVNVKVIENEIYNNDLNPKGDYLDAGIWIDGGYHVVVRDNNIHDNNGPAIQVSDSDLKYPYQSCHYKVIDNTFTGNYWTLYVDNFGICPFPDKNVLVYKNNLSHNNKYPGGNPEYEHATSGDILCLEWPCGEHKACVGDDFDKSVRMCE